MLKMRLKVTHNFESFIKQTKTKLTFNSCFLGLKNDLENKIKIQFDTVSTNIETTIESLKKKLDSINASLQDQIQESKEKVKK